MVPYCSVSPAAHAADVHAIVKAAADLIGDVRPSHSFSSYAETALSPAGSDVDKLPTIGQDPALSVVVTLAPIEPSVSTGAVPS